MGAVGIERERHVNAVVDEQRHARVSRDAAEGLAVPHQLARRRVLEAQLHGGHAAGDRGRAAHAEVRRQMRRL